MATLAPAHVGDYAVPCPRCQDAVACPVHVEPDDSDPGRVALRAVVNVEPIHDHLLERHGVRLSRPARR